MFTRAKKGMLALYGTDLHVVDVLGLEAADVASGSTDVTSHVLRWVNYVDVSAALLHAGLNCSCPSLVASHVGNSDSSAAVISK